MSESKAKLTIKKGTLVFSTLPGWPSEGRPAGRTYTVEIAGYDHPCIKWAGSAGYWKWVKL